MALVTAWLTVRTQVVDNLTRDGAGSCRKLSDGEPQPGKAARPCGKEISS
jgi:hypothetical protein